MTAVEKLKNDIAHDLAREQELDTQLLAAEGEEAKAALDGGTRIATGEDPEAVAEELSKRASKVRALRSGIDSVRESRRLKLAALQDAKAAELETQAKQLREQSSSALARFTKHWNDAAKIQELTESAADIIHRFNGISDRLLEQARALQQRATRVRQEGLVKRHAIDATGTTDTLLAAIGSKGDGQPDALVFLPAAYRIRDWVRKVEEKGELKQAPTDLAMLVPREKRHRYERVFHLEFSGDDIDPSRSSIRIGTRMIAEPQPGEQLIA